MRCMEDRLSVTLNKRKEDCSCVTLTRHNLRNCPKNNGFVEVWPFQPSAWDRRNNYVQDCSWTTETLLVELRKSVTFDKNEGQRLCREVAGAPLLEAKEEDMTKILEDVRLYTVKKKKAFADILCMGTHKSSKRVGHKPSSMPQDLGWPPRSTMGNWIRWTAAAKGKHERMLQYLLAMKFQPTRTLMLFPLQPPHLSKINQILNINLLKCIYLKTVH